MAHDILFLLLGLALIILGGNYVTDGAVAIAGKFHMSSLLVGLTIVAFGSSTPDLVVSVMATAEGKSQLAIGDVVGADIFDFLLVVGVMAMISPVPVSKSGLKLNCPMAAMAAVALFVCADDRLIDGAQADFLTRTDGLMMLLLFAFFMAYAIMNSKADEEVHASVVATAQAKHPAPQKPVKMWLAAVMIAGGLAALVIGGNWIVDGASGVARRAGMSEALIGLTIVAIGSSLPDLATSVMAAIKHQPGLAMGNVMGSCIMDILFVLGTCGIIAPVNAKMVTVADYAVLMGAALLVWIFAAIKPHRIRRWQGAILVSLYLGYMIWIVSAQA